MALAPTDDLARFWRSKVKVTAGHRGGDLRRHPHQCWGVEVQLLVV